MLVLLLCLLTDTGSFIEEHPNSFTHPGEAYSLAIHGRPVHDRSLATSLYHGDNVSKTLNLSTRQGQGNVRGLTALTYLLVGDANSKAVLRSWTQAVVRHTERDLQAETSFKSDLESRHRRNSQPFNHHASFAAPCPRLHWLSNSWMGALGIVTCVMAAD